MLASTFFILKNKLMYIINGKRKKENGCTQLGNSDPLGDIWQYLGIVLVVTTGSGGATGIEQVEGRGAAGHQTCPGQTPQHAPKCPQMLVMLRLKNPAVVILTHAVTPP